MFNKYHKYFCLIDASCVLMVALMCFFFRFCRKRSRIAEKFKQFNSFVAFFKQCIYRTHLKT